MPRGHFKENRFQFLLLALLLQFALGGWFPKEHNDFIHAAAMVGWLAAAIYALRLERRHLIAVVAAGLVVVGLMFIRGAETVEDAAAFFVLCALGAGVLRHILRAKQVTFDTVCASLSVYIVIGLVFATIYIGLVKELGVDEHGASVAFTGLSGEDHSERWRAELAYFSYVTMTTLGYGDITPKDPSARSFVMLQAIVGQIYLLTLVAGLVGLQVARGGKRKNKEPADSTDPSS